MPILITLTLPFEDNVYLCARDFYTWENMCRKHFNFFMKNKTI